jgi:hypothetical protein
MAPSSSSDRRCGGAAGRRILLRHGRQYGALGGPPGASPRPRESKRPKEPPVHPSVPPGQTQAPGSIGRCKHRPGSLLVVQGPSGQDQHYDPCRSMGRAFSTSFEARSRFAASGPQPVHDSLRDRRAECHLDVLRETRAPTRPPVRGIEMPRGTAAPRSDPPHLMQAPGTSCRCKHRQIGGGSWPLWAKRSIAAADASAEAHLSTTFGDCRSFPKAPSTARPRKVVGSWGQAEVPPSRDASAPAEPDAAARRVAAARSSPASAGATWPRTRTSRGSYSSSTVPRSRTRARSSPAA